MTVDDGKSSNTSRKINLKDDQLTCACTVNRFLTPTQSKKPNLKRNLDFPHFLLNACWCHSNSSRKHVLNTTVLCILLKQIS